MKTICMKCQILFSRKIKKSIISLLSAKYAHSMENVKVLIRSAANNILSWVFFINIILKENKSWHFLWSVSLALILQMSVAIQSGTLRIYQPHLELVPIWANSVVDKILTLKVPITTAADDIFFFFFLFFRENKSWHFMWIDSHKMSRLVFSEK